MQFTAFVDKCRPSEATVVIVWQLVRHFHKQQVFFDTHMEVRTKFVGIASMEESEAEVQSERQEAQAVQ